MNPLRLRPTWREIQAIGSGFSEDRDLPIGKSSSAVEVNRLGHLGRLFLYATPPAFHIHAPIKGRKTAKLDCGSTLWHSSWLGQDGQNAGFQGEIGCICYLSILYYYYLLLFLFLYYLPILPITIRQIASASCVGKKAGRFTLKLPAAMLAHDRN